MDFRATAGERSGESVRGFQNVRAGREKIDSSSGRENVRAFLPAKIHEGNQPIFKTFTDVEQRLKYDFHLTFLSCPLIFFTQRCSINIMYNLYTLWSPRMPRTYDPAIITEHSLGDDICHCTLNMVEGKYVYTTIFRE